MTLLPGTQAPHDADPRHAAIRRITERLALPGQGQRGVRAGGSRLKRLIVVK